MKRIISVLLAAAMILSLSVSSFAATCDHTYEKTSVPANCKSPEYTLYTCSKCSESYKKYTYEYEDTGKFTLLLESERDEEKGTLKVDISIKNNPGIIIAHMKLGYNAETLSPVSYEKGVVFAGENNLLYDISFEKNPFNIYAERDKMDSVHTNGLLCSITFNIIDKDGDYGIVPTVKKGDFTNWETELFDVSIANLVGKKELGGHVFADDVHPATCTEDGYTKKTCSICNYFEIIEGEKATGHSFGEVTVTKEPTLYETGEGYKICEKCLLREDVTVPKIESWIKGDLNNDKKVTAIDANLMLGMILGKIKNASENMNYAADLNGDKKISSADANMLKKKILGS